MGVISTNEFRKRARILLDGQPCMIVENEFVKPGKGQAFNRVKLKNLLTGRMLERTFKSGENFEEADITYTTMQFLFTNGEIYTFMDTKSYEQVEIDKESMDGAEKWLLENTECEVAFWGEKPISVTPPIFMDLVITYTEPAVKGDTANNVTKKATIETGGEINVPLFIGEGMKVRVDTRTGEYVERAK
ncbi:MAG TPA: elongation factor P [Fibrobacteres bacterium]|jgi:elongation factor P|nr:elongation factor P [Fibrobacterota bacterium]